MSVNNISIVNYDVKSNIGKVCITIENGQKLYKIIYDNIKLSNNITIDLCGVIIAAPFLNAAIGQLYKDFSPETIEKYLCIVSDNKYCIINQIKKNASLYYNDDKYRESVDKIISEMGSEDADWR